MEYKVSIVTPFHDVEEAMFKRCVQSMLNQTIGFENIEWIVVLHNCNDESIEVANKILGQYPNVKLPLLNNDAHTPSSPRNYGMTLATAPYLGYLDGDDTYADDCLEIVVRELQETKSQVIDVRRNNVLEDESMQEMAPPIVPTLWNQSQWRIVVEKGYWDQEKMFFGMWGFITSKFYDRQFLIDNDIKFEEDILWGEDFIYAAFCMLKADRICYLPQYIGYNYVINGGSLLQSNKISPERVITYYKCSNRLFQVLEDYGIDINEVQHFYWFQLRYYLNSDLTLEDRIKIRDLCAPYILRFSKPMENKLWGPEITEMIYRLPREIIMNPENPFGSKYYQDVRNGWITLMSILRENKDTDYGIAHGFATLTNLAAYNNRVPRTTIDDYKNMIAVQTYICEKNVIAKDSINRYFLRDGKLIPCTDAHFAPYLRYFKATLSGKHNLLLAFSHPISRTTPDKSHIDTLEGMMIKDYFSKNLFSLGQVSAEFTSRNDVYFQTTEETDYAVVAKDALLDEEVNQIVAINTSSVAAFFEYIKNNWKQLIDEIKAINAERAAKVEKILSAGYDDPIAIKLWPKLERIVAFGAGELFESTKQMKLFTGDVPHNHGYYYTEECIFGRAKADDTDLFCTIDNGCFFEGLSLESDTKDTCFYSEVKLGVPYSIVVTNRSGLYRCETNHIVCPVSKTETTLEFKIY